MPVATVFAEVHAAYQCSRKECRDKVCGECFVKTPQGERYIADLDMKK